MYAHRSTGGKEKSRPRKATSAAEWAVCRLARPGRKMLLSAVLGRIESREGSKVLSSALSSEAGASRAPQRCDKGPYVLDTLHYTHEGLGK